MYSKIWLLPKRWEGGSQAWFPSSRSGVLPAIAQIHSIQARYKQDRPRDGRQAQPIVQIIRKIPGDKAGQVKPWKQPSIRILIKRAHGQEGLQLSKKLANQLETSWYSLDKDWRPGLSWNQAPRPMDRGPMGGWSGQLRSSSALIIES